MDKEIIMDGYLLGILWGTCSYHHNGLICRHKNKYYVEIAATQCGGRPRRQKSRTGIQWAVNLPIKIRDEAKISDIPDGIEIDATIVK
jgi:hypothetical protein